MTIEEISELLPDRVRKDYTTYSLRLRKNRTRRWVIKYRTNDPNNFKTLYSLTEKTLGEALYKMFVYLKENNLLYTKK